MAENERTITTVFKADISNFSASTQQLNRYVAQVNSEFRNATASMGRWNDNTDGLQAKLTQLNGVLDAEQRKLKMLEDQYADLVAQGKENTEEAQNLATAINNQSAKVKEVSKNIDFYTSSLKELEDAGVKTRQELDKLNETSEKQGETAKSFGGGLMKGAAVGIAGIATAAVGATAAFLSLGESTREVRENFSRLETSFATAGLSAEQAQNTYNELYGVLGDTGRATEAAQQLAKISKDNNDLAANTRILTGVMAEYGDSIPTEGLAEGMAATAAMGEVQGVLADALEWQGVNLDEYNAQLATMTSEEERAAYIQSTLTELYGASADAFEENNKAIIEAREAEAALSKATAELGAVAEPIMTTLKLLAVDLLTAIKPFVELMGEGLSGALAGTAGAADTLAQGLNGIIGILLEKVTSTLPMIINVVVSLLPKIVETILNALPQLVSTLATLLTQTLNALSEMLPTLIPVIISALLLIVETILDNLDLIIDAAIKLIMALADGLIAALPNLIDKIPIIINKLVEAISTNLPKLVQAGIQLIIKLASGLIQAIPQLVSKIPQIITSLISGFKDYYSNMGDVGLNLVKGIWQGIKDAAGWLKDKITGFAGDVAGWFKDTFKIKSPSGLMEDEVGEQIGAGVGVGIINSEKKVKKDVAHFNKSILSSLNNFITGGFANNQALAAIGAAGHSAVMPVANNIGGDTSKVVPQNIINNYNVSNKFEKMETSRLAMHKANLELKRYIGG